MAISSPSSGRAAPRSTEWMISRLISPLIVGCGLARITSNSASFCSWLMSEPYLRVHQHAQNIWALCMGLTAGRKRGDSGAIGQAACPRLCGYVASWRAG